MGYLLSLSGLDGSGKTTQAHKISSVFKEKGLNVEVIHLKNLAPEQYLLQIKEDLKFYTRKYRIHSKEEAYQICCAFLFCAKVEDVVLPSLEINDLTILDRYRESALCAHHLISKIYSSAQKIYDSSINPDCNVFLDSLPSECYKRIQSRDEMSPFETPDYLEKAYSYYNSIKDRFTWINASQSPEQITQKIVLEMAKQLEKK